MGGSLNFKRLFWFLAGMILLGCGQDAPIRQGVYQGGALGTSYAIKVYTSDSIALQPRIDSVFRVINRSLSTYLPDSDISRINDGDSTVIVDAMFREVFDASEEVYTRTDGYFDPTVGILVDAWGFGPGQAMELDSLRIDSLLHFVGYQKITLSKDNRIVKETPGIRLDFNAIAKGYAVDRLAVMLERYDIEDFLIEVGGELRATGRNREKNQAWLVGIDDPQVTDGRAIKKIIFLEDRSMASSGNYRKFRIDSTTGRKYVHTIDPHTGYTKNSNILATSVLAPSCMLADAYATAFMAMDLGESLKILEDHEQLQGYIIYLDEGGQPREFMTDGFKSVVQ